MASIVRPFEGAMMRLEQCARAGDFFLSKKKDDVSMIVICMRLKQVRERGERWSSDSCDGGSLGILVRVGLVVVDGCCDSG